MLKEHKWLQQLPPAAAPARCLTSCVPLPCLRAVPDPSTAGSTAAVVTVHGVGPSPRQFYTKRLAADAALIPTLVAAGVEFGVLKQSMSAVLVRCAGRCTWA